MSEAPSQRARDAAADILACPFIRAGEDDTHHLVQAFARFEANLKAEMVARVEGLRLSTKGLLPFASINVRARNAALDEALAVIRESGDV